MSIERFFFVSVRPSTVQILSSNQPLSADRSYDITCQTSGSRPPARISWFLDGKELKSPKHFINTSVSFWLERTVESTIQIRFQVSYEDNSTISVLSITPTRADNNRTLTCRATNPKLKKSLGIEDNVRLIVYCKFTSLSGHT